MTTPTRDQLLVEAENLIRRGGYSAFSYAHLTEKIGITKASIHYHFPTKQRLAEAVVDLAQARFAEALKGIEAENTLVADQLHQYAMLFLDGFEASLRPLCGALSAELAALPPSLHERTAAYFRLHLDWLTRVLEKGITAGELHWTNGSAALAPARFRAGTCAGGSPRSEDGHEPVALRLIADQGDEAVGHDGQTLMQGGVIHAHHLRRDRTHLLANPHAG